MTIATDLGGAASMGLWYARQASGYAALMAGKAELAAECFQAIGEGLSGAHPVVPLFGHIPLAVAQLAAGDVEAARRTTGAAAAVLDDSVGPYCRGSIHELQARLAIVDGFEGRAESLAHEALDAYAADESLRGVCDVLELLGVVIAGDGRHDLATRLFGAASSIRADTGCVRMPHNQEEVATSVSALRAALGDEVFDQIRAEGESLSAGEAVAYASRGRGERRRPTTGWASLTPAELEVARLVGDGLANKEIADKLFVSPRTVQAHLTHVYAKLDIASRTQLASEAARRTWDAGRGEDR